MLLAAKGYHTPNKDNNSKDTHPGTITMRVGEATTTGMQDVVVEAAVAEDVDVDTKINASLNATTVVKLGTWHMNARRQRKSKVVHPQ